MKTTEELNALKEEIETLNRKLGELSEKELEQVTGGTIICVNDDCANCAKTNCKRRRIKI